MSHIQKITLYLWFNGNAEQAVEFYTSLFANSRVTTAPTRPHSAGDLKGPKP